MTRLAISRTRNLYDVAKAYSPGPITTTTLVDWARQNDLPPATFSNKSWVRELSISGSRWSLAYPFQFIVVEQAGDGSYIEKKSSAGAWKFTLPIPPQEIGLDMPFAISTHATLGGIVEQHNGAPFRMISLSGSTGVLFGRDEAPVPPTFSFTESVFAGTISATSGTKQAFSEFQNGSTFKNNVIPLAEFDDEFGIGKLTGYFQWRLLNYFMEAYVELKKTKEGRSARLAFANHKDQAIYLVTPINVQVRKSVPHVFEYAYSIQLKAWKRIRISSGTAEILNTYVPVQRDPNKLAKLLTKVENARRVLQGARKTILAIGGDVQHSLFEPVRELSLFAKDALSVPLSVADLADSLIQATKASIIDLKGTKNAISNFPTNIAGRQGQVTTEAEEIDQAIGALAAEQGDDPQQLLSRTAHPANSPFLNPSENFDFFSSIQVGDLHLPPAVMGQIGAERARVRTLTRLDFEQRRDAILETSTNFANALGVGDATFNAIYGVEAPPTTAVSSPTDEDFDVLYALNDLVTEMNRLVVTNDNDPNDKLDSIAAVAGLASRSGIAFRTPRGKFAVPFPYGSTLEMLSARYLQDPNRWMEIAALNGLQTPYVDEEGFEMALLTNGSGNCVTVADASNLFVGQPVWISSNASTRTLRRITKIDVLSPSFAMVTVNGDPDMDSYGTLAHATLHAFLPNTVNSQQTIFIPSDKEPKAQDFKMKAVPGVDIYDPLITIGGIDLLLTPKNDLVITPDGDSRWSVGLTNVVQFVRLAFSTRTGTLLQHPEFGLPLEVGQSVADLSPDDVVRSAQAMFENNPTFSGVANATIDVSGPTARLGVGVTLASSGDVIPVSAEIAK